MHFALLFQLAPRIQIPLNLQKTRFRQIAMSGTQCMFVNGQNSTLEAALAL